MIDNTSLSNVRDAKIRYYNALKNGMGIQDKRQAYVNTLLNNADALIETALDVEDLLKQRTADKKKIAELQKKIDAMSVGESDAPTPEKKG